MTGVLALLLALSLTAETEPPVPLELQAELLSRVLKYDRQLPVRAGAVVKGLIVHDDGPASLGVARRLEAALAAQAQLGALPHEEKLVRFESSARLAELVRLQHPAVVVFTTGFATHAEALARELDDLDLLGDLDMIDNESLDDGPHLAFVRQLLAPNWGKGRFHLVYAADMPPLWRWLTLSTPSVIVVSSSASSFDRMRACTWIFPSPLARAEMSPSPMLTWICFTSVALKLRSTSIMMLSPVIYSRPSEAV